MTNSDLYYSRTGNSLRAAIAIEIAGINPRLHAIDLVAKAQRDSAFLELNPAGTVPVLVEHSNSQTPLILTQSGAILEYLVSCHRPDLLPQNPADKALAQSSTLAALSDIAIQNALANYLSFHPESAKFVLERMLMAVGAAFKPLQQQLFFGGATANIADYAHFPVIYMRERLLRNMNNMNHILDWLNRMKNDHAINRAVDYAGKQLDA